MTKHMPTPAELHALTTTLFCRAAQGAQRRGRATRQVSFTQARWIKKLQKPISVTLSNMTSQHAEIAAPAAKMAVPEQAGAHTWS